MYIFRQQRSFGMGRIPSELFRTGAKNKKELKKLLNMNPEEYANKVTQYRNLNKVAIDPLEEKAKILKAISDYHGHTGPILGNSPKELKEIIDRYNRLPAGPDRIPLSQRGAQEHIRTVTGGKFGVGFTPEGRRTIRKGLIW